MHACTHTQHTVPPATWFQSDIVTNMSNGKQSKVGQTIDREARGLYWIVKSHNAVVLSVVPKAVSCDQAILHQ